MMSRMLTYMDLYADTIFSGNVNLFRREELAHINIMFELKERNFR